jgi:hypothetical protein
MAIHKLYSKQQRTHGDQNAGQPRYDVFPNTLRVQLVQILDDLLARGYPFYESETLFDCVERILCKEYGVFFLGGKQYQTKREGVLNFVLNTPDVNQCLDVLQITFETLASSRTTADSMPMPSFSEFAPRAIQQGIEECNQRFQEHHVGFQFVGRQIVRLDSEFTHKEITIPALIVLSQDYLKGADEEFLSAQEHYRHGRYKECLNDCLKAFESTMKSICDKRGWVYNQTDTAKTLIAICEKNKLFPVFLESHLTGLRTSLESGVPTARNKTSGHGQGAQPISVSEEFATYVLNLTATNIRFLAASEGKLK